MNILHVFYLLPLGTCLYILKYMSYHCVHPSWCLVLVPKLARCPHSFFFLQAPRCSSRTFHTTVAEPTPQDMPHGVLFNRVRFISVTGTPGVLLVALKNLSDVLGTFGPLAVQLFPLHNETIHDRIHQHSRQRQRLHASKTFNEDQTRVSADTTQFAQDSTVHNGHTGSWTIAQHNVGLNMAIQRNGFVQTNKSGPDGGTPTLANFSGPCDFVKRDLRRWRWAGTIAVGGATVVVVVAVASNVTVCPCFGF